MISHPIHLEKQKEQKECTTKRNYTMAPPRRMARSSLSCQSPWEDGLNLIDELLEEGSPTAVAMTDEQSLGLKRLKVMLLSGFQRNENHIPVGLLSEETAVEDNTYNKFLLHNFAGYFRPDHPSRRFTQIVAAHKIAKLIKSKVTLSSRIKLMSSFSDVQLPEQWYMLDVSVKRRLCDLLSWTNLRRWDFNIFEVDDVLKGKNTLLFVGWAILASPNAQYAMEMECRDDLPTSSAASPPSSSSPTGAGGVTPVADREGYNFISELGIKDEALTGYITAIEQQYVDNPYHNKTHAADVVQTVHALIQMGGSDFFCKNDPVEAFALLVAAAVHDVGHPGMNNSYQVASMSQLAITYNDRSVLENMHASRAFEILMGTDRNDKCDILASFTDERKQKFRSIVIKSILSTDMTKHFAKKNFIKGILLNKELECFSSSSTTTTTTTQQEDDIGSRPTSSDNTIDTSDPTTAMHILGYILHLADISNPAKSSDLAAMWADRVLEEFFLQGDKEAELALPISPLCDRRTTSRPQSQIGFINFIVLPAYELLGQLIPQVESVVLPQIKLNLTFWEEQKQLEQEGGKAAEDKTEVSGPPPKKQIN